MQYVPKSGPQQKLSRMSARAAKVIRNDVWIVRCDNTNCSDNQINNQIQKDTLLGAPKHTSKAQTTCHQQQVQIDNFSCVIGKPALSHLHDVVV
jgi:hypothetical protein